MAASDFESLTSNILDKKKNTSEWNRILSLCPNQDPPEYHPTLIPFLSLLLTQQRIQYDNLFIGSSLWALPLDHKATHIF